MMERQHMKVRNIKHSTNGSNHSFLYLENVLLPLPSSAKHRASGVILGVMTLPPLLHSWACNALAFAWGQWLG